MAEQNDQNDRLEVNDEDAEALLNDNDEGNDQATPERPEPPATGDKDWKAEAEKWRKFARKNEADFKTAAEKLREYETANMTESQRLQQERDSHKTRAEQAEWSLKRREIAEELAPEHATLAQIKAVAKRLSGDSDEALQEDARELFALLAPAPATPKTPARPRERLRGGGEPEADDPDDTDDPRKLADRIRGTGRS